MKKNYTAKRFLDITLSAIILVIFSPIIVFVLVLTALLLRQFPIVIQERGLTLESKKIRMFKIRTIRESHHYKALEKQSTDIYFKKKYKTHVPNFCSILRITGLDEILQFINVIKGDMSIVGPRPFILNDLKLMKENENDFYERRKNIFSKPGITGVWQVWGNRNEGTNNLVVLEEFYDFNKSFTLDMQIISASILIGVTGSNYDAIVSEKMPTAKKKYCMGVFRDKIIKGELIRNE